MASRGNRQLPFVGGIIAGTGVGLWLFMILARTFIMKDYGPVGIILIGLALVFLGMTLGCSGRKDQGAQDVGHSDDFKDGI